MNPNSVQTEVGRGTHTTCALFDIGRFEIENYFIDNTQSRQIYGIPIVNYPAPIRIFRITFTCTQIKVYRSGWCVIFKSFDNQFKIILVLIDQFLYSSGDIGIPYSFFVGTPGDIRIGYGSFRRTVLIPIHHK